jgi:hypothetical protein
VSHGHGIGEDDESLGLALDDGFELIVEIIGAPYL